MGKLTKKSQLKKNISSWMYETFLLVYFLFNWIVARQNGFLFTMFQVSNLMYYIFTLPTLSALLILYTIHKIRDILVTEWVYKPLIVLQIIITIGLYLLSILIPYFYISLPLFISFKILYAIIILIIFNICFNSYNIFTIVTRTQRVIINV